MKWPVKVKYWACFSDLPLTTSHDHEAVHYVWPHKPNINSEGIIRVTVLFVALPLHIVRNMGGQRKGQEGNLGKIILQNKL